MPYNRWGAKSCALCSDPWLSRTGVCIGCDAGMCRTFFHVTWYASNGDLWTICFLDVQLFCWSAQREGLLSETFHEDAVQADPFYANCKLHTEKSTMRLQSLQFSFYCMDYFDSIASKLNLFETNRRRKSNYLSHQRHLQWWTCKRNAGHDMMNTGSGEDVSLRRILRKLDRQRVKFHTKHWPRATWGKPFFLFIHLFYLVELFWPRIAILWVSCIYFVFHSLLGSLDILKAFFRFRLTLELNWHF